MREITRSYAKHRNKQFNCSVRLGDLASLYSQIQETRQLKKYLMMQIHTLFIQTLTWLPCSLAAQQSQLDVIHVCRRGELLRRTSWALFLAAVMYVRRYQDYNCACKNCSATTDACGKKENIHSVSCPLPPNEESAKLDYTEVTTTLNTLRISLAPFQLKH